MATLADIRIKARRVTRSPSTSQITDAQLDEYINTFLLYDFPQTLRTFEYRDTFTFVTTPYIDTYGNSEVLGDQFFQFKDRYISIHQPAYIAGQQVSFSQSREEFYAAYPLTNRIVQVGTGNGANNIFVGTVTHPILRNNVLFSSIGPNNRRLAAYDDGDSNLIGDILPGSVINYVTGAFTVRYNANPLNQVAINAQTIPYTASKPYSILYFNNEFILRPVPDQPYEVSVEVYRRPTELIAIGDIPYLEQYWQYIALGASIKIFEDRLDVESIAKIMPIFKNQEDLLLSRSVVQQTKQRTATIYTNVELRSYDYNYK